MAGRVCPPWVGFFLLNPLRKFLENPDSMLGPFIKEGMIVLEPGCGMGYFTLPLARMVGPKGRVMAVEIQPKMLSVLGRRAGKAGLLERIELRSVGADGMELEDLSEKVDFAAAIHMVHELPDPSPFFSEIWKALKPSGKLLVIEPKGHVSLDNFQQTAAAAANLGFKSETIVGKVSGRSALFYKPVLDE